MTDQSSEYRQKYENKRLDEAYRLYVDGKATVKQLATRFKSVSLRTLQRKSATDKWMDERDERKRMASHEAIEAVFVAASEAAATSEADLYAKMAAAGDNPDQKTVVMTVLKRQQKFWDRLEARVISHLDLIEAKAKEQSRDVALGQIIPIINAAERVSNGVRKAYGIPDVSKLEFEDKTTGARRHADVIRERRVERLARRSAETVATALADRASSQPN